MSFLGGLIALGLACNLPGTPTPAPTVAPQATATSPASPTPLDPATATEIFTAITGPVETVYDWSTDRCAPDDIPDMPSRAFRNADGQVIMNRSRPENRLLTGSELGNLQASCELALDSSHDPDPSQFNSQEWFQAFHTDDGQTVHAILHNEHCDGPGAACQYQNMTYARSDDGGMTFQQPEPPGHVVAGTPFRFDPERGFYGMPAGSSIVRGEDGHFYMAALQISPGGQDRWVCMLRTDNLEDPSSWRAWDGEGFHHEFPIPYLEDVPNPEDQLCPAVAREYDQLASMHESLTYSTYLQRYVLLGAMDKHVGGRQVWGIYYSLSPDLVQWSERRLLLEAPLSVQSGPGGPDAVAYPTLLDPDSPSDNFDRVDQDAFVYYTRFNFQEPGGAPDADLVRFPVSFHVDRAEAVRRDVRTDLSLSAEATTDGLEFHGNLKDRRGEPLEGLDIAISLMPQDVGRIVEYQLAETVPAAARTAVAGIRMNTECNCVGPGEVRILEFSYREEGGVERVPNGSFQAGLDGYFNVSSGTVEMLDDIEGQGPGVRIEVGENTDAAIHSRSFSVTGGADFEFRVRAIVVPGAERSGYFVLIFPSTDREVGRMKIPLRPYREQLDTVTTDEQGNFRLVIEPPSGAATIKASFEGTPAYWPSSAQVEAP